MSNPANDELPWRLLDKEDGVWLHHTAPREGVGRVHNLINLGPKDKVMEAMCQFRWQPIETVPETGHEVLLWSEGGRPVVGCFVGEWCSIALDGEKFPLSLAWFTHWSPVYGPAQS